jgi:hypothetical protein
MYATTTVPINNADFPTKNGLTVEADASKNVTLVTRLLIPIQCALRSAMNSVYAQKDSFETCPTTAASQSTSVRMICVCIMNNGMSKAMTVGINRAAKMDHLVKLVIHDATVQQTAITKSVFVNLATSEIQLECALLMANVHLLWVSGVNADYRMKSGPTVAANANKNVTHATLTCTPTPCALKFVKKCASVMKDLSATCSTLAASLLMTATTTNAVKMRNGMTQPTNVGNNTAMPMPLLQPDNKIPNVIWTIRMS